VEGSLGPTTLFRLIATYEGGLAAGSITVARKPKLIGRSSSCALVLPGDGVSRTHASVYMRDGRVVINDEGSANGVQVNDSVISGPALVDQDSTIRISKYTLRLSITGDESDPSSDIDDPNDSLYETQLEAVARPRTTRSQLVLVGRGGRYDARKFAIDAPIVTLGRDPGNAIQLDDSSVSRQHVQLRIASSGDHLTVLDLRSANGTFVDGQRVKRAEVAAGAVLRIGDLVFKLDSAVQRSHQDRRRSRRRRGPLIAAATALTLIGFVVGAAYLNRQGQKSEQIRRHSELAKRTAQIEKAVEDVRADLGKRRWERAEDRLDQVLVLDPLNREAIRLRRLARREIASRDLRDKGNAAFSVGTRSSLVKARDIFSKITPDSVYADEARDKLRSIQSRLATAARSQALSRCRVRRDRECYKRLCSVFENTPTDASIPSEARLRQTMQGIERHLREDQKCDAMRYLAAMARQNSAQSAEILKARYPRSAVRNIVEDYLDGRIDIALRGIHRLSRHTKGPTRDTLNTLKQQLLIIRTKYQQGLIHYRQREAPEADLEWSAMLGAEQPIIPKEIESFYRREATQSLAKLYFELGQEQFQLNQPSDALALWSRGKQLRPQDAQLRSAILQLEQRAEQLVQEARTLIAHRKKASAQRKLRKALTFCDKGSRTRAEALKLLKGAP